MSINRAQLIQAFRDAGSALASDLAMDSQYAITPVNLTAHESGAITAFDTQGIWHVVEMPHRFDYEPYQFRLPNSGLLSWEQQRNEMEEWIDLWLGLCINANNVVIRTVGPVSESDIQQATEDLWNEA